MVANTVEYTVLYSETYIIDTESDKDVDEKLKDLIKRERPSIPESAIEIKGTYPE